MWWRIVHWGLLCVGLALYPAVRAAEVRAAVAANFAVPMKLLISRFEQETGHQVKLSVGATAKLYAQIKNGAPFDVFLAADVDTPARLARENGIVPGSRFTYASGRLILWSARPNAVDAQGQVLKTGNFRHLAIASPKLAPYGAAAIETLTHLGLIDQLRPKLVMGESIGQAFNFVATGNAELGLVALSQTYENSKLGRGSGWIVPAHMHRPLHHDAALLMRAINNPAASALLAFLKTDPSRMVIRSFGYEIP